MQVPLTNSRVQAPQKVTVTFIQTRSHAEPREKEAGALGSAWSPVRDVMLYPSHTRKLLCRAGIKWHHSHTSVAFFTITTLFTLRPPLSRSNYCRREREERVCLCCTLVLCWTSDPVSSGCCEVCWIQSWLSGSQHSPRGLCPQQG